MQNKLHFKIAWIFEDETLTQKDINFVPGLYKLFDEVLTNASDHKVRSDTWIKLQQEGKESLQIKKDTLIRPVKNIKVHINDKNDKR